MALQFWRIKVGPESLDAIRGWRAAPLPNVSQLASYSIFTSGRQIPGAPWVWRKTPSRLHPSQASRLGVRNPSPMSVTDERAPPSRHVGPRGKRLNGVLLRKQRNASV